MAHGDAREGKWRGNWRMEWVASTLHTTSEHGVSSITTADAHTSAAGSRLNWRPRRFKWTRPLRRKTKFGFCVCAITFQTQSKSLPTFRENLSVPSSGVKKAEENLSTLISWPLKIGPIGFSKTSLCIYHYTLSKHLVERKFLIASLARTIFCAFTQLYLVISAIPGKESHLNSLHETSYCRVLLISEDTSGF
jgi:hypothetical protein